MLGLEKGPGITTLRIGSIQIYQGDRRAVSAGLDQPALKLKRFGAEKVFHFIGLE
jgi:hypothetical protein